jgi:hypothetical protein
MNVDDSRKALSIIVTKSLTRALRINPMQIDPDQLKDYYGLFKSFMDS